MQKMEEELMRLPAFEYMVRSSTTLEDSDTFSHAGQFRSVAGLQGKRSLVKAIEELWTTSHLARDVLYSGSTDHFPQELEYAVILQRMIPSVLAGVAFSKNPVNEQHETIVEAVEGPGEELMQKGTTPFRWRFRSRELVDGAEDHPLIHVIREVAGSTRKIKRIHGRDIDLEWVYDGEDIYYVQVRSITVEKDMQVYSNKMAQEMLPGQIKPLVWSVNIPLVNGAWISILSRITGPLEVRPEDLARSFYSRTYFNVAKLGEIFREFGVSMESLENTMLSESSTRHSFRPGLRTLRHTFRIIRFIFYVLRFEKFYLKEYAYLSGWYRDMARKLSMAKIPEEYAALFGELFEKGGRLVHLNILIPLLMRIYNRRLTGKLLKIGIDYNQLRFTDDFP